MNSNHSIKMLFNRLIAKIRVKQLDKETNLMDFLQKNEKNVTVNQLVLISLTIARILVALSTRNIVHGLIRCKSFSVVPLAGGGHTIRLTERPSRDIDGVKDRFWLPPDHSFLSLDVYAFGTTLWEVFSFGRRPNVFHVGQLLCPSNCPSSVWTLIRKCWTECHDARPTPIELYASLDAISQECQASEGIGGSLPWIIPFNHLQPVVSNNQLETLGRGNFGQVFKAYYPANSTHSVAIKKFNQRSEDSDQLTADSRREFEIMTKLSHPNIIKIIGIVKDPEIMLIMELVPLGPLNIFLRKLTHDRLMSIPFLKYAHDIALGMEYLETKRIVHRDLASRNILMASTSTLKIADFGLSQSLARGELFYAAKTVRYLPSFWYAPESIAINPVFSLASDVWSFGVTLWEIFTLGCEPDYPIDQPSELIHFLRTGARLSKPKKGVPGTDECWPVIVECWDFYPSMRPHFTQLRDRIDRIRAFS